MVVEVELEMLVVVVEVGLEVLVVVVEVEVLVVAVAIAAAMPDLQPAMLEFAVGPVGVVVGLVAAGAATTAPVAEPVLPKNKINILYLNIQVGKIQI